MNQLTRSTIDYEAISNAWTFLEVHVGIICVCIPALRAQVVRCLPQFLRGLTNRLASPHSRRSRMSEPGDRPSCGMAPGMLYSTSNNHEGGSADEMIILQHTEDTGVGGIKKTVNIDVRYREV
jgi:hypothetical protein